MKNIEIKMKQKIIFTIIVIILGLILYSYIQNKREERTFKEQAEKAYLRCLLTYPEGFAYKIGDSDQYTQFPSDLCSYGYDHYEFQYKIKNLKFDLEKKYTEEGKDINDPIIQAEMNEDFRRELIVELIL